MNMKSFVMMIVVSLILLINSSVMAGCCRRAVETKLLKEEQNAPTLNRRRTLVAREFDLSQIYPLSFFAYYTI